MKIARLLAEAQKSSVEILGKVRTLDISWNSLAIYSAYMTEGLERLPRIAKKIRSVVRGTGAASIGVSARFFVPQSGLPGADDGLCPVRYLQLEEDVRDVVTNSLQAHKQLFGYLLVGLALGDQGEDLFFALGKLREGAPRHGRTRGAEEAYEALGNPGTEDRLAAGHGPYRVPHLLTS